MRFARRALAKVFGRLGRPPPPPRRHFSKHLDRSGGYRRRADGPGRPPAALAARLLPAGGQRAPADALPGGAGPRRQVLLRVLLRAPVGGGLSRSAASTPAPSTAPPG